MIDKDIFLSDRAAAKARLPKETSWDSFGYYIDTANSWENIKSPTSLSSHYAIHKTHEYAYQEISFDVSWDGISKVEKDYISAYNNLLEQTISSIHSNHYSPELKYDFIELLTDWRIINKYVKNPKIVYDFGAGCGRQLFGTYFWQPSCKKYVAIDASYAGYCAQESLFNTINIKDSSIEFVDLFHFLYHPSSLDINNAIEKYVSASPESKKLSILHLPAWFKYLESVPDKSIDLIFACHVHNELSRSDFLRLIALVKKGLSRNGIFYVRSELKAWNPYSYDGVIDMHAVDIIETLAEDNIKVIFSEYTGAFQTTIFARSNGSNLQEKQSKFYKKEELITKYSRKIINRINNTKNYLYKKTPLTTLRNRFKIYPNNRYHLNELNNSEKSSYYCAHNNIIKWVERIKEKGYKSYYLYHAEGEKSFNEWGIPLSIIFEENENLSVNKFKADLSDIDVIIICSQDFNAIEELIKFDYSVRIQYTYPVVFLFRSGNPIYTEDLISG